MNKKFLKLVSFGVLTLVPFSVSANYEAKLEAEKYIKGASTFDLFWKGKEPYISAEKYFHSINDEKPSYIEYKVSCKGQEDCGYVMVNLDNTDVKIPEASSVGKTSSEIMEEKSGKNSKNYYFSVFEQFSENEKTGEIGFINPENEKLIINSMYRTTDSKSDNSKLKEKFEKLKKETKENSRTFIPKEEKTRYESRSSSVSSPYANGAFVGTNYINGDSGCFSYTPCYHQYSGKLYNSYYDVNTGKTVNTKKRGVTGASPTALSIVYGYYDRNGKASLINGLAPGRNDYSNISKMQMNLGDFMGTTLEYYGEFYGWTDPKKFKNGIRDYLNNTSYSYNYDMIDASKIDYSNLNDAKAKFSSYFERIKSEINNGRVVVLEYGSTCKGSKYEFCDSKAIVVHGYNNNNMLIGNFGTGPSRANKTFDFSAENFVVSNNGNLWTIHFIEII